MEWNDGMDSWIERWMYTIISLTCVTCWSVMCSGFLSHQQVQCFFFHSSLSDFMKWSFPNSRSPETSYSTMHGRHVYYSLLTIVLKIVRLRSDHEDCSPQVRIEAKTDDWALISAITFLSVKTFHILSQNQDLAFVASQDYNNKPRDGKLATVPCLGIEVCGQCHTCS